MVVCLKYKRRQPVRACLRFFKLFYSRVIGDTNGHHRQSENDFCPPIERFFWELGPMPISPPTKREAMVRGEAVGFDAFAVLFGGIAGIVVPAVMGIFLVELLHIVVAVSLGKD